MPRLSLEDEGNISQPTRALVSVGWLVNFGAFVERIVCYDNRPFFGVHVAGQELHSGMERTEARCA